MRGRAAAPRLLCVVFLILGSAACGDDDAPAPDGGVLPDGEAPTDGSPPGDGAPGDGAVDVDGGVDGGGGADGSTCACDVTSLCDTGCACDIACSAPVGDAPLGGRTTLSNRAEMAIYFASAPVADLDRVTLRDDAWTPSAGDVPPPGVTPPTSPYASLLAPAARPAIAAPRAVTSGDVDDDGRDEVVLVTATAVIVEDWDGAALAPRTVATHGAASAVDVDVADVDGDLDDEVLVLTTTGTTATVRVLSVPASGSATELATTALANVARAAITFGDVDGDGDGEVIVVHGRPMPTWTELPIYVTVIDYDGAASSLTARAAFDTRRHCETSGADDERGDADAGDLDDDGAAEIVFAFTCGYAGSVEANLVDFGAVAALQVRGPHMGGSAGATLTQAASLGPSIRVTNMRSRTEAPGARRAGRFVLASDSGTEVQIDVLEYQPTLAGNPLDLIAGNRFPGFEGGAAFPSLALADVDMNGDDELVVGATMIRVETTSPCFPGMMCQRVRDVGTVVWAFDRDWYDPRMPVEVLRVDHAWPGGDGVRGGPLVALGDFDGDGLEVRATGEILLRAGPPHVNAVLAAPPTWLGARGIVQAGSSGTSFGVSESMGGGSTQQIAASATATVSAEGSFLMGLVEVRASISASVEYASAVTMETTTSTGGQTTTGPESDMVVYRMTPYASHVYEVVSHPNPDARGSTITIDVPGEPVETARDLASFRTEYGSTIDGMIPPGLFQHTIGDPTTYAPAAECNEAAIDAALGGSGDAFDVFAGTQVDVGTSPSGSTERFVTFGEQTTRSTELTLGVEISAGVSVGGVGLDVSAGISTSWTHATTIGHEVTYTGSVSHIAGDGYTFENRYRWGLCVFHFRSADGTGSYPVIGYTVDGM